MSRLLILTFVFVQLVIIGTVSSKPLGNDETTGGGGKLTNMGEETKLPAQFEGLEDDDDDDDEDTDFCAICLDGFDAQAPVELMCPHRYHFSCLEDYYETTGFIKECFLCNRELRTKDNSDLGEFFDIEKKKEAVENIIKIGLLAGHVPKPRRWRTLPDNWEASNICW